MIQQKVAKDKAKQIAKDQYGQQIFPAGSLKDSLVLSVGKWKTWALVAIYFTTFGGFIALTAWLPTYWKSFFEVSAFTAGLLTATYSITTSVVRVGGGALSDKLGGENALILALLFLMGGSILMAVSPSYGLSIGAEILMALGMGISNAAVFKLVPQEVPDAVGGAAGWVGGIGAFGGFAIPPILGAFVRTLGDSGYSRGFVVYVALAILSLSLAFILKRTHISKK